MVGDEGQDRGVDAGDVAARDGGADQHGGDGLGHGAGVAPALTARFIEIDLVHQPAVAGDQDAGDLLEGPGADGGVHGRQPLGRDPLAFRRGDGPGRIGRDGGRDESEPEGRDKQGTHDNP